MYQNIGTPDSVFAPSGPDIQRKTVLILLFFIYFIDNALLSVIVPIIPDYLEDRMEAKENFTMASYREASGKIGALFASKSLVQLMINPIAGWLTSRVRIDLLIFVGNTVFFISSIIFAMGRSYESLFFARSIHGIGSSLSVISGLAMLAASYHEDTERSKGSSAMGIALGGMAVGVLFGYPVGGFMYDSLGKAAPFFLVASCCLFMGIYLLMALPKFKSTIIPSYVSFSLTSLVKDTDILICISSIGVSTLSIATLEPCLPVWLRSTIKPDEWEIGTAFIPDSIGYLIGTNLFGIVALRLGRWLCATCSHIIVGLCCFAVPLASSMGHLIVPHFGIGLGIAVVDASLMPLLASVVDTRYQGAYGEVYALSQTTVCMAYGLGPLLGGWLMGFVTFKGLIWSIGVGNLLFVLLTVKLSKLTSVQKTDDSMQQYEEETTFLIPGNDELQEFDIGYTYPLDKGPLVH